MTCSKAAWARTEVNGAHALPGDLWSTAKSLYKTRIKCHCYVWFKPRNRLFHVKWLIHPSQNSLYTFESNPYLLSLLLFPPTSLFFSQSAFVWVASFRQARLILTMLDKRSVCYYTAHMFATCAYLRPVSLDGVDIWGWVKCQLLLIMTGWKRPPVFVLRHRQRVVMLHNTLNQTSHFTETSMWFWARHFYNAPPRSSSLVPFYWTATSNTSVT